MSTENNGDGITLLVKTLLEDGKWQETNARLEEKKVELKKSGLGMN